MTLEQKVDVLDKLECGGSVASVGRHFYISDSSARIVK
jgi:hypothetical protein